MAKDREVLIKLRRKYSKDETISAMEKQMKVLEREKGELLAEIDFLKQEKEDLKKDFEPLTEEQLKALNLKNE